jgi:D-alanyl-D-alanine carboxypeptidase
MLTFTVPSLILVSACGGTSTPATSASSSPSASSTPGASAAVSSSSTSTADSNTSPTAPLVSSSVAGPVQLDDATTAKLQESFQESFGTAFANGVLTPGAVAYVSVGDDEWISSLGVTDVTTGTPVDPGDHGRIGSISKPFVATAVLRLVGDGKLTLDDTLEQYIAGIPNGDSITIRQLLSMSAGVWSYTSDDELIASFQSDPMTPWTIDQTIDLIRTHPADYPPGEKVVYSDSNFVLLGRIIELVTGQPVGEVIRTQVVEPLGLTGTRMPADDEPNVPDTSLGSYMPVDGNLVAVPDLNPTFAWTAGAMTSTAADLAVLARELTDSTLLTPELQAERLTITQFTGAVANAGYGLGVIQLRNLTGHTGAINGGGASMFRYVAGDATFVVLVNGSSNFENVADLIANSLIADLYPDQASRPGG